MIFDTNILIYADRGVLSAKDLIMNTKERSISAVTSMEYVPFCRNKRELAVFEKMLRALQFTIYEIDHIISYLTFFHSPVQSNPKIRINIQTKLETIKMNE